MEKEFNWKRILPLLEAGDTRNAICKKAGLGSRVLRKALDSQEIRWVLHKETGEPGIGHYEFPEGWEEPTPQPKGKQRARQRLKETKQEEVQSMSKEPVEVHLLEARRDVEC